MLPPLTCPLQLPAAVQLSLCLGPVAAVSPQGSLVLGHHGGAWARGRAQGSPFSPSLQPAETPRAQGVGPCHAIPSNEDQQAGVSPPD